MKLKAMACMAPVVFMLTTVPSLGNIVTLDCKMNLTQRSGGWIPSAALVEVDSETKLLNMIKPTAKQLNGRVTSAKLVRETADKMILRWEVKGTRSASNQVTPVFKYRAVVKKPSGEVAVIAKPLGYSNDFRAKGTCVFK